MELKQLNVDSLAELEQYRNGNYHLVSYQGEIEGGYCVYRLVAEEHEVTIDNGQVRSMVKQRVECEFRSPLRKHQNGR